MGLYDPVFQGTNINFGLDAEKPLNPTKGQIYVATDTNITYVCYETNVWKNIAPAFSVGIPVGMSSGTVYGPFDTPTLVGAITFNNAGDANVTISISDDAVSFTVIWSQNQYNGSYGIDFIVPANKYFKATFVGGGYAAAKYQRLAI